MAALSEPARPFLLGAGAPARLARDLRYRVPFRARRLDHPALRNLCSLCGLYRARPDRDDPDVQRDVEFAVDGLRPRNGKHADPDGEPAAALVSLDLEAPRRSHCICSAGLRFSRHCIDLGDRASVVRLYYGAPGSSLVRADAGGPRIAALLGNPSAREL